MTHDQHRIALNLKRLEAAFLELGRSRPSPERRASERMLLLSMSTDVGTFEMLKKEIESCGACIALSC